MPLEIPKTSFLVFCNVLRAQQAASGAQARLSFSDLSREWMAHLRGDRDFQPPTIEQETPMVGLIREEQDYWNEYQSAPLYRKVLLLDQIGDFYRKTRFFAHWVEFYREELRSDIRDNKRYGELVELNADGGARLRMPMGLDLPLRFRMLEGVDKPPIISLDSDLTSVGAMVFIRLDTALFSQPVVCEGCIEGIRVAMDSCADLKPIRLVYQARHQKYVVDDGHHRLLLAKQQGSDYILATVIGAWYIFDRNLFSEISTISHERHLAMIVEAQSQQAVGYQDVLLVSQEES